MADMAHAQAQRDALRILEGIENGTMTASQSADAIEGAEPAMVYLILTWIRSRYGAGHAASDAVLGRLAELTNKYPSIAAKMKEGKEDSIVEWFEDAYSYRELDGKAFVEIVVDKFES